MVWNVQFQIAGFILTAVCSYLCLGQQRLDFKSEKSFIRLLISVLISIFLDISSVAAINYSDTLSPFVVEAACELYLISILAVAYLSSLFAVVEASHNIQKIWKQLAISPLLVAIIFCVIFKTTPFIDRERRELYSLGVPVVVTYIFAALYIVSTIMSVIIMRKNIGYRRRKAAYGWCITWLIAAFIQFFNNKILLVSFAMSLACIYMYSKLENPEYQLDITLNVFNRRGFSVVVDEDQRSRKHRPVVAFSINNLSAINEIFGNRISKKLIKEICEYAKEIPDTTLFRLDDGTFALTANDVKKVEGIAEKLEKRFKQAWNVEDSEVNVSVGFAYILDVCNFIDVEEVEEVLHYFLNVSRKNNNIIIAIGENEMKRRKRDFEVQHALEWALANKGVEMFYQPIYNISAGRFTSMEALVRIRDEKGNLIMPVEFIELAEKNGLILKLGEEIFRSVCEFIERSHPDKYGIEYIEVNLSTVQCGQVDLAKHYANIMAEYQVPPHMINLEITETAAISTQEQFEKNMSDFLKYGNTFSLDDFGSGYSNLTYIVGLPLKIIKIDRSLTISYDDSEKARVTTEYTVEMIHKLGMEIVVEGIETEEQYLNFKKLGVEFIQGYYFSKPLPKDRVLQYVQEWL